MEFRIECLSMRKCIEEDRIEKFESLIKSIETYILFNEVYKGNDFYKLLPSQEDRNCFQAILRCKENNFEDFNNQIAESYKYFFKQFKTMQVDLVKFKEILTKNLMVVSITLNADENPHRIFESVNYKGLPLTQGDLVRNYFFMRIQVDQQESIYRKLWQPMQIEFEKFDKNPNKGNTLSIFIRYFLMKDGANIKENEIYSSLKEKADRKDDNEIISFLQQIRKCSEYYLKFLNPENEHNEIVKNVFEKLKIMDVTMTYPFLLNVYELYDKSDLNLDGFIEVLRILENFIIRRYLCEYPTNQLNKLFPPLFGRLDRSRLAESLKEQLTERKFYPTDKELEEKFPLFLIYQPSGTNVRAKLVLRCLEMYPGHKETLVMDNLQIEHVMPQTLNESWKNYLGEDWQEIYNDYLHTIGNLTLTGYNLELSNKSFEEKKVEYERSHLELNRYFKPVTRWDGQAIQDRAKKLTISLLKIWPSLTSSMELKQEFRSSISSIISGTKPRKLIISGQGFPVKSWKEVLIQTLEMMYSLDEDKFIELSEQYPSKINTSPSQFRKSEKLANGYYAEVNLSSKAIINFCSHIITFFELTEEDLKIETE